MWSISISTASTEATSTLRSSTPDLLRHRSAPFRMRILSIDVAHHTAVAKLLTPVGTTEYVDYLSIQSIAGTWMVVHKLFSDEVSAAG
jgi:hypothetical protein